MKSVEKMCIYYMFFITNILLAKLRIELAFIFHPGSNETQALNCKLTGTKRWGGGGVKPILLSFSSEF